jgi:cathepsin H
MLFFFAFVSTALASQPSFDEWLVKFEKTEYALDPEKLGYRRRVYEETVAEIEAHNAENSSWTMGVNAYSDLTWPEFKAYFNLDHSGAPQKCSATGRNGRSLPAGVPIPDKVNWQDKGMVTPVKNQGSCGSCWAFSTTGALESAHAVAGKPLVNLAEQQLVDCAGGFKNNGCKGGLPSQAFQYLMWAGGQELGSDYKYTAKDGKCQFAASKIAATIKDEFNITVGDETDTGLPGAVAITPTSICYQVASDFRNYKSGVYTSKVCKNGPMDVNHAVLAVGYDVDSASKLPYYYVKNSWGTSFGIKGYFKIVRGKNMCGIATCSSYPIV